MDMDFGEFIGLLIYIIIIAVLIIGAGYLIHLGWNLVH